MTDTILNGKTRQITGKQISALRQERKIPAVVYGPKSKNINLTLGYQEFVKVLETAGQSSLVDLHIDDSKPAKVLIHAVDSDPISGQIIHVDFYELDMDKKQQIDVALEFTGEASAVRDKGGELIKVLDKIQVECLPKDLVKTIEVNVSSLAEIGDHIYTKDINLPQGLELLTDPELVVASAEEIREEMIEEPASTAEEGKEGEAEEGDKKPEQAPGEQQEKKQA